ncbi:MAG: hypothetical protein Greene041614_34 [Parcubacteria group bacterium Greene0416_14]|nr:MAG: hypothetical protein Greene041614_34 [Parcubacteria group bacterium Greene0416_14]TSD01782.1 MAG: hypothetical protein Greene101415_40 [Parcubacteria group bacterium Greene1014_15]TSD08496.1 MAG: hypothetical protein Greene07144_35 [Parcubacteria group bacterium Greene0714_4]
MRQKKRLGILGGGISAVSLSYLVPRGKFETTILEKENTIGGLARSFNKEGFVFDVGPHIIFAKDKKILHWMVAMLGENKHRLYRNNCSFYRGRFIKYPFENGLAALPKEDLFECLYHFINNNFTGEPKNFKEWMYATFGKGIAEKYLIPYNKKIWKIDPSKLTTDWVGGRVPKPPIEDIIKSAIGIETEGYTHQLHFYYPLKGGVQSFVNNILRKAEARHGKNLMIVTNCTVVSVIRRGEEWVVMDNSGNERVFDILVNTMPVHVFVGKIAKFISKETRQDVLHLRYNSLALVFLGLEAPKRTDRFAIYFPEEDTLFHRVSYNDYVSPHLSPKDRSSVTAEITYRPGDVISKMTDATLTQHCVHELHAKGIIDRRTVLLKDVLRITYEYPVYDFNYAPYTKKVYGALTSFPNLYSCGRFAEFRYINMNDCIKSAMEIAKKL